ncbi:MAG: hypothetical protein KJ018_13105, partial [Burkholderiales bacterium]|nr:hypothetical protein [Burkholderiales bacterium]
MSAPRETPRNVPGDARSRRTLVAIVLVVLAPVVLSYGFYYLAPPGRVTNNGELLPTVAFPAVPGTRAAGAPFD